MFYLINNFPLKKCLAIRIRVNQIRNSTNLPTYSLSMAANCKYYEQHSFWSTEQKVLVYQQCELYVEHYTIRDNGVAMMLYIYTAQTPIGVVHLYSIANLFVVQKFERVPLNVVSLVIRSVGSREWRAPFFTLRFVRNGHMYVRSEHTYHTCDSLYDGHQQFDQFHELTFDQSLA